MQFIYGNVRNNIRQIFWNIEKTGGAKNHVHSTGNHTLTIGQIPSHNHEYADRMMVWDTDGNDSNAASGAYNNREIRFKNWGTCTMSRGNGEPHNHGNTGSASNLNPYFTCYMFKRTK